ncbi:hypothetical protein A6M27_01325 [Acidithiobacillus thiooxidans]|uniref:Uncharacterized protein n=1 Tax=Acidithiobacillus thiooxidans TaxID=930 RepID=A0A1C2JMS6_ACITH|nr:hypothetical protein [Acidithiobacillus thiooxidans]OCX76515.1 hypothetical protein A6O24_08500 [Acidithiobacillus thiooxidans]OCX76727.1 hypothetical protein A6P07_02030 [Acidithiobacillus thiooxidans]OCX81191.1 hypothetical protein A6O26_13600 [Acidithiobacillus thiooxidans]OCX89536.1 hypothetical protein A6M27_01325 [Acidithiobacillus thiooxidans]
MKIHKFTVSLTFALAMVPMVAMANAPHQWWVLTKHDRCVNADTLEVMVPSAEVLELQNFGRVHSYVNRLPGGRGVFVDIQGYYPSEEKALSENGLRRIEFDFFSTKQGCSYWAPLMGRRASYYSLLSQKEMQ